MSWRPSRSRSARRPDAGSMTDAESEREAFELAVGALAQKERTEGEMRAHLQRRGAEPAAIESAIARLLEIGELDDASYAERFAADKRELRGWGPERIRETLIGRGIPGHLAEQAARDDPADSLERAVALLGERGAAPDDERAKGRALAFLARRGYDYEVAYEAVRRAGRAA